MKAITAVEWLENQRPGLIKATVAGSTEVSAANEYNHASMGPT